MEKDSNISLKTLRVDGGAVKNDFLMGFQSDLLDVPVERQKLMKRRHSVRPILRE